MIQKESILVVADNSGAKRAKCIGIIGGTRKRFANVGDIIVVSVFKIVSRSKIAKGSVYRAVLVRSKAGCRRDDGTFVKSDDNAVVLLNKQKDLVCTRVFGHVYKELRERGFLKIISLAEEVV